MNEHQRNTYQLAENLGIPVTTLMREMSLAEYFGWMQFYSEKSAEAEREAKKKPPLPRKDGELVMRGFGV